MSYKREALEIAVPILIVIALYAGFALYMGNWSPFMVVMSGSMVPALRVGWIIIVKSVPAAQIRVGNIIVYHSTDPEIPDPIVHRVIKVNYINGTLYFLTKGDANPINDAQAGFEPANGIPQARVIGKVVYVIPYLGYVVLFLKQPPVYIMLVALLVAFIVADFVSDTTHRKEREGEQADSQPKRAIPCVLISFFSNCVRSLEVEAQT